MNTLPTIPIFAAAIARATISPHGSRSDAKWRPNVSPVSASSAASAIR
jgi:hypothetical protein